MVKIHEEHEKSAISSKRLIFILSVQIFLFLILILRLFYLQIINYDKYKNMADDNRIKNFIIPPLRGHIFDRNNLQLTENQKNYRVLLYQSKKNNKNVISKLSKILNLSNGEFNKIMRKLNKNKNKPIISILDNVTWDDLIKIEVNSYMLNGIMIENGYIRHYPFSNMFSHIIGYVNNPTKGEIDKEKNIKNKELLLHPDYKLGRTGLERLFNKNITGEVGFKKLEMNALSIPIREIFTKNSTEGKDIKLTIDFKLQKFIKKKIKNKTGAVIVMNVQTGEVLAMVSSPSYNANKFVEGISSKYWKELKQNPAKPLTNKTVSAIYPPGSTFKLITAIAGLESGWNEGKIVNCTGALRLNRKRVLHCWKESGHSRLNLKQAIQHSCNIFFTKLGLYTGIDNIYKTATDFGLGEKYEIRLLNKKTGLVPNREWKRDVLKDVWVAGDTVNTSIGQGFLSVTPLELVVMTSRIANGGYQIKPYIISNSPIADYNKTIFNRDPLVSPKTIEIVKEGMYKVVNEKGGTAYWTRIKQKGFEMSGKTGTAQVIAKDKKDLMEDENEEIQTKYKNHGLFVAFAPFEKPKYAIVVVAEHGGGGSGSAAPIAKDVLYFAQKHNIGFETKKLKKEDSQLNKE